MAVTECAWALEHMFYFDRSTTRIRQIMWVSDLAIGKLTEIIEHSTSAFAWLNDFGIGKTDCLHMFAAIMYIRHMSY